MIKHLFINHSLMKEKGFWGFGVIQATAIAKNVLNEKVNVKDEGNKF